MNKKNIEAIYPLSPMQEGMLFDTLYTQRSGVYVTQWVSTLHGDLNVLAFKHAWQQVTDRHSVLRTLFSWEKLDSPRQIVLRHVRLPWTELDWRAVSSDEQAKQLESFLQADRLQGFELAQPPLFRLTLIRLAEDVYQLIWSSHHLLLDGWSSPMVIREVLSLYEAERLGQPIYLEPSRPYRDYIMWLQQQDLSKAEAFWRKALQGFTTVTPLVRDWVTRSEPVGEGGTEEANYAVERLRLSLKTTLALQSLARQHRLTLNTLAQGAWSLLLSCYSGEEDVVFGVVVSARPPDLEGVESMVGSFINTLPLRVHLSPDVPLLSWLQDLQAQHIEARQYEYSSLVQVRAWSEIPMDQPLFESLLVFENRSLTLSSRTRKSNLEVHNARTFERARVPLLVQVIPAAELCLQIGYDTGRFDHTTIIRMLVYYQNLLESIAAHPEQRLVNISPLSDAERRQILLEWNLPLDSPIPCSAPFSIPLHALVETQAHLRPDAVALCFQDEHLSYAALNARANQLAHFLLSLALPRSRPLAILLSSPVLQVISLLAILKAGHSFVYLDPASPHVRLHRLLAESNASCLLSQESCLQELPSFFQNLFQHESLHFLSLDLSESRLSSLSSHPSCGSREHIDQMAAHNPNLPVVPTDSAYLVWTSGSTGTPKSMLHPHQTLAQFLLWFAAQFQLTPQSRVAQWAGLTFDAAYVEIFSSLASGATLCLAPSLTRTDPDSLARWLACEQVTLWQTVPSFLRHLLPLLSSQENVWRSPFPHLQCLLLAGEALPAMLVRQARLKLGEQVKMVNLYGPTEAILATFQPLERSSGEPLSIPIGRPIAGRQVLVLDRWQRVCPIGVKGELYLRSPFLTQGYVGQPAESARAFVPDPVEEGATHRVYRTGDMGRWRADGTLEFEGRGDRQVKIRGVRVELEEVEAVLSGCKGVIACAVVDQEEEGEITLAGYLVLEGVAAAEEGGSAEELLKRIEEEMRQQVPGALVPSRWMIVDEVPRTLSGKVDRLALAKQKRGEHTKPVMAPRTPLEETLVQIWSEVFKRTTIGVTDNFFALGGHSLLATQVVVRVRRTFNIDLLPRDLFEAPTIAHLAERIQTACQAREVKAARIAQLLEQVQQLSDDEASSLLARKRFEHEDHR